MKKTLYFEVHLFLNNLIYEVQTCIFFRARILLCLKVAFGSRASQHIFSPSAAIGETKRAAPKGNHELGLGIGRAWGYGNTSARGEWDGGTDVVYCVRLLQAWAPDSPVAPKKKAATTKATKATVRKKAAAKPKGDAAKKKKAPAANKKATAAAAPAKKKKKKSAYSDEDEESEDDGNDDFGATGDSDVEMIETPTKGGKNPSIEQIYQKKTQLEHILLRPDTYSTLVGCVSCFVQRLGA
jgi:hypothetical protein